MPVTQVGLVPLVSNRHFVVFDHKNMETPETVEVTPDTVAPTEVVETPVEMVEPSTPASYEDLWNDAEVKFETPTPDESDTAGQDAKTPETVVEPPKSEVVEEEPKTEEETPEEESDEEKATIAESPFKLNRKDLRKAEAQVITPFRDPETPIEDVLKSLYEFNPDRTRQLTEAIVKDSVNTYPDQWVQALTGVEGLTVEQVKQAVSGVTAPSAETPTANVADRPEIQNAIQNLTEIYGEDWKDPAKDAELIGDDAIYVPALRNVLAGQGESEKDVEIATLKTQLAELKPTIEGIKSAQEAEYERKVADTYKSAATEYRTAVENRTMPQLFKDAGIEATENDPPEVKSVKELAQSFFKPTYGEYSSDFDMFATNEFSQRESLQKVVQRVDNFLAAETKAKIEAERATKDADKTRYEQEAQSFRRQADMERDTVAVLHQKAAKEFLSSSRIAPILQLLEANADLQRRLGQGRPELIGSSAPSATSWADRVKEASEKGINPFDLDLGERVAGVTRN